MVRFLNEHDSGNILRFAHKLCNIKTEYPHVGIAPDRTWKKQTRFRYIHNECSERQAKGKQVIIINSSITQEKRSPKDNLVSSSAAPIRPQNIINKTVNYALGKTQCVCLT